MSAGNYYCGICGAPGGHGNLQCPNIQVGTPGNYFGPMPGTIGYVDFGAKLDRIIDLLEALVSRRNDAP